MDDKIMALYRAEILKSLSLQLDHPDEFEIGLTDALKEKRLFVRTDDGEFTLVEAAGYVVPGSVRHTSSYSTLTGKSEPEPDKDAGLSQFDRWLKRQKVDGEGGAS